MLITKKLLTHEASYKSCASAAKLRSRRTQSSSRLESQGASRESATSNRYRCPSQADKAETVGVPSASSVHCAHGSESVCRANQLGSALSNDCTRRHGVTGRDSRHDRRIGDAQVVDAIDLEPTIDD